MMKSAFIFLFIIAGCLQCSGRLSRTYADSIRRTYHVPELGYAVISGSRVMEEELLGIQQLHTQRRAKQNDRFRIGSNTKAITGFIAAQLVHEGKISWNTKFFDLFPDLKAASQRAYFNLSLQDLLSFRTKLISYTYTDQVPTRTQFGGDNDAQRRQFVAWCLRQAPTTDRRTFHISNAGYVAAGMMLEKSSGNSYRQLVQNLGGLLGISFGFGQPNNTDLSQPWGHDAQLIPEPPGDSYKLGWLEAAGNINVSLPDYVKFIQAQLQGLRGNSPLLSRDVFQFLYFGLPGFAIGWFWALDHHGRKYAYNIGNPGSFLSKVYVFPAQDRAFILFANAQTEDANEGLDALYAHLQRIYLK